MISFSGTLSAQTITWTGGANDGGNWNTPGNWDLGVVPGAADDAHIFGIPGSQLATATDITIDAGSLELTGRAGLNLNGAASAGGGSYSLEGTTPAAPGNPYNAMHFAGSSTAANATITVVGNTPGDLFSGSLVQFVENSTAGNANLSVEGEGQINFAGASSAGSATIVNDDRGLTSFTQTSSAGSATITNNAGGVTSFSGSSSAAGATLVNNAGGVVNLASGMALSIGSLSGAGSVYLSNSALTLGALNRDDVISGVIQDGTSAAINAYRQYLGQQPTNRTGGSLVKAGTGTLVLTGDNTYTGGTTISAGTLQLGDGGTSGSIVGNVQDDARLVVNRSDSLTLAGNISGTGTLEQVGAGTTVLTGNNSYAGGTTISAGTLQLGDGGTSGSIVGDVLNDATLAFNRADALTFDGSISGTGAVNQIGTGTTLLTGDNPYSGATTVSSGTLLVGDAAHASAALSGGGAVQVAAGATLGGYGSVQGPVSNAGTLAVADAALPGQGTGAFVIGGALSNAGLVQLAGTGVGNKLTVGSYAGQGGRINLNTVLGGDASPTDQLVIDGGSASGQTSLQVTNVGGLGAATPGNGILLVNAVNGATSEASAFSLGNSLEAGPYRYSLYRGSRDDSAPDSWFLRSQREDDSATPPPTGGPVTPTTPDYRPETSLYAAIPSLGLTYAQAMVDSLHERVGEENRSLEGTLQQRPAGDGPLGWGRMIYRNGQQDREHYGQYGEMPKYDYQISAFQVGLDLFQRQMDDGSSDRAGLSLAFGNIKGGVDHYDHRDAGDDTLRGYSLGGYWTHFGASGWYLDGVLQYTYLDIDANSRQTYDLDSHGQAYTASLEGGYPFEVGRDLYVEPQLQATYTRLDLSDSRDSAASVRFDDSESLVTRAGVRLAKDWLAPAGQSSRRVSLWLRPSVLHDFQGESKTRFSSADGDVPFKSDIGGSSGELTFGVDVQADKRTSFFATGGYQQAFDGDAHGYSGNLGFRVLF
ncbi:MULTISPECIES: autotransporter outer membrane beta-barrel domain-containing protein [Pseudomonas]|uniref:autotransporter family protein n=1 Tax=Pseudomonas TaxID=286 RepID=UPI0013792833|nr:MULTISPECIES: autotransporter outer membrane beta-barrel domain-containing protein [Pseudomonas]WAB92878.1 autotransporter outer membrane beta-barrel domain-containing protein [Pseudomonas citronellolis]